MKKLLLSIFLSLIILPIAYAGECTRITDVDDYWMRVKSGVNIRDKVCDGNVIGTLSTNTVVKVVGHIEGWRYIERPDGGNGFVWSDFLEITSAPSNPQPTPTPISTPDGGQAEPPQEPLYDVGGHDYETAIRYLGDNEIVQGYPDGAYRADNSVNRAEFTKIIVGAALGNEPASYAANCFPDVKSSDWFSSYVCYAKENGIISGYPDGYFRPANNINLAEAAKILVNTLDVTEPDIESEVWYRVYIEALQNNSYIPSSLKVLDQLVNRGEMAEMTWRIMENIQSQPFTQFTINEPVDSSSYAICADNEMPSNIDMNFVRATWLGWYNSARADLGLHAYTYNNYLNYSATTWSEYSLVVGVMSHKRPGQTAYYDYNMITQWFADLGITFKNVYRVTYSENIGRGYFSCNKTDCTQDFINAIRPTFDFYMAEKGKDYTAHYDSVMNAYFYEIGIGFAVDSSGNLYTTVHYGTELTSHPEGVCN